jgi:hypothetical protein
MSLSTRLGAPKKDWQSLSARKQLGFANFDLIFHLDSFPRNLHLQRIFCKSFQAHQTDENEVRWRYIWRLVTSLEVQTPSQ